jgi:threonine dehydrogenase-like Zn-dependent dehydrogenase
LKAVCLPFNINCGHSKNCERGLTTYCLRANDPGTGGGAFGFAHMGPWPGGQAEYLWMPWPTSWACQVLVFFNGRGADYGSIEGGRARPGI